MTVAQSIKSFHQTRSCIWILVISILIPLISSSKTNSRDVTARVVVVSLDAKIKSLLLERENGVRFHFNGSLQENL